MKLTSLLQRHMLFEEQEIFPLAIRHLPAEDLERLGQEAERMRDVRTKGEAR